MKQQLRVCAVSDTHNDHWKIELPDPRDVDIFIHAGDFSHKGSREEIEDAFDWLESLEFKHKIIIAGNHDYIFADKPRLILKMLPEDVIYLQDTSTEIGGWNFYGNPTVPRRGNAAFALERNSNEMRMNRALIPKDVDVLITHAPPWGIRDTNHKQVNCGCEKLRNRVDYIQPKFHIFGHIHSSFGHSFIENTNYYNVAYLNGFDERVTIFDLMP